MAGSSSGLYVNGVLSHSSWSGRPAKRARTGKSARTVWNSTDDWDDLVATSTLSTASVSSRAPRPRGLQTLALCAENVAARSFKRLYEEGKQRIAGGTETGKGFWELEWEYMPDHLKTRVRDAVFRRCGGLIKLEMIRDLFLIPPELHLPGHLLPAIASAEGLKILIPAPEQAELFTSIRIQHCPRLSDVAVAGLIYRLPNLELLNLKGCSLVGGRTVKTIIERCPNVRGLNVKGTKISEEEAKALLDHFGDQLERFKIDGLLIQNPHDPFSAESYPRLTHLCLPGDLINAPAGSFTSVAKRFGHTLAHPTPRPNREDARFAWHNFEVIFPALTHLYLPGLLIPPKTVIRLKSSLVKLALQPGGPPVPIETVAAVITSSSNTLRSIQLGHLLPSTRDNDGHEGFKRLGIALQTCSLMEDFRFICDPGGSRDLRCDRAMQRYADQVYTPGLAHTWQLTLKHLHICLSQKINSSAFQLSPLHSEGVSPVLEQLSLPSGSFISTTDFISSLTAYRHLRTLDLSGTAVTTDEVFTLLDSCPLLSKLDLTSCRGVGVRLRRSIFEAWEESRKPAVEPDRSRRRTGRR